jgi:Aspartate/tyrosine/aromatic aminotransferase
MWTRNRIISYRQRVFHKKVVSEYTTNLCANAIGQYIFSSILKLSKDQIREWHQGQRNYYQTLMLELRKSLLKKIPDLIISTPESALYFVIDFRMIFNEEFDIEKFIEYCATVGKCRINNNDYTILLAPMTGFYYNSNDGRTQARIAIVETEHSLRIVPEILANLIDNYSDYIRVN